MPTRSSEAPIQRLISLPPSTARAWEEAEIGSLRDWFVANDPPGSALGSGGGTAHLLWKAWEATGQGLSFREWLRDSSKLIVHGGGQSRRLPAYGPVGKPLMPIPVMRHSFGQSLDQTWLDVQAPQYDRVLSAAPERTVVMIASGDVLLRFTNRLPRMPEADVVILGMPVEPEDARHFGVLIQPRREPGALETFLQKPSAGEIEEWLAECECLVDTGMWLLSEEAVMTLMRRSGWLEEKQAFEGATPASYELYAGFGLSLGRSPRVHDAEICALTSAVVAPDRPEFYHLGNSRQVIETFTILQNQGSNSVSGWMRHPDQFILNSVFDISAQREINHTLWIENSTIRPGWRLDCEHVITGVPPNEWSLNLERGACLDFVPVGESEFCVRAYGIDDRFRGAVSDENTNWFGRPASQWFSDRGLSLEAAGIDPGTDIQSAPLFPLIDVGTTDPAFIQWLFASQPTQDLRWAELWLSSQRLSANDLRSQLNVKRLLEQRARNQREALQRMHAKGSASIFQRLDLSTSAKLWVASDLPQPARASSGSEDSMSRVHDAMFRSAILRYRGADGWQDEETTAFSELREAILTEVGIQPVEPVCSVMEDQIVWGRSPARLDLAGGWSDTPPYCLEHGGKVVNVAVDLNGQPPIQVFARRSPRPELVIRSIDLGVETRITSYDDLASYAQPGSEFALARASLAVAGFLPRFHAGSGHESLERQLEAFGGGIQLSLLAAMPQGSGLGTSSILTATVLGTLSELCGLNWDKHELVRRTLAVEQMLTTGGGWQDQAGAIFGGVKLLETTEGHVQRPVVRWLPDQLFGPGYANSAVLLYYTGLTRLAKNILQEIVRGMFLNSQRCLDIVGQIRDHAEFTFDALQRGDYGQLCEAIHTSWILNQRLDSGTNPPEVQSILDRVAGDLCAVKLLGAGGGGYLLMLAKDAGAGERIREKLTHDPPNDRARFVRMTVSQTGLEVTRS